jgi:2-keto-4-pentenoate hydratase/2-oxohepta-3-ene-1,7-dioic acid hydratase in catechol pathway
VGEWVDGEISYFGSTYDPDEVDVLPPTEPSKVILVGRNTRDSIVELGIDPPTEPRLFFAPPSAVVGHGDTVVLPAGMERVVYGAELGVVVGRQCRSVPAEEAAGVIEGYTCVHDVSLSDVATSTPRRRG